MSRAEVFIFFLPAWMYTLIQLTHAQNATLTYNTPIGLNFYLLDDLDLSIRDHLLFKLQATSSIHIVLTNSTDTGTGDLLGQHAVFITLENVLGGRSVEIGYVIFITHSLPR